MTKIKININCDVGEGVHNEAELFKHIQSCNIACGGHAGDARTMNQVVELGLENELLIGAHPSYPDRIHFGRKSMLLDSRDFIKSIFEQVTDLMIILGKYSVKMHHIKAHGALYNDLIKNAELSELYLKSIESFKNEVRLYVPFHSEIAKTALKNNFKVIYEAFADRNYNDDLSLVSRSQKEALISNPRSVIKHVQPIIENNLVKTITGKQVAIKATTYCVHSDAENAVEIVQLLNRTFNSK